MEGEVSKKRKKAVGRRCVPTNWTKVWWKMKQN